MFFGDLDCLAVERFGVLEYFKRDDSSLAQWTLLTWLLYQSIHACLAKLAVVAWPDYYVWFVLVADKADCIIYLS